MREPVEHLDQLKVGDLVYNAMAGWYSHVTAMGNKSDTVFLQPPDREKPAEFLIDHLERCDEPPLDDRFALEQWLDE